MHHLLTRRAPPRATHAARLDHLATLALEEAEEALSALMVGDAHTLEDERQPSPARAACGGGVNGTFSFLFNGYLV